MGCTGLVTRAVLGLGDCAYRVRAGVMPMARAGVMGEIGPGSWPVLLGCVSSVWSCILFQYEGDHESLVLLRCSAPIQDVLIFGSGDYADIISGIQANRLTGFTPKVPAEL